MNSLHALPSAAYPVIAIEPASDAYLLSLGHALEIAYQAEMALPQGCHEEQFEAVFQKCSELANQIMAEKAHTLAGILVKAKAVSWCRSGENFDLKDFETTDEKVAASIINDLMAM